MTPAVHDLSSLQGKVFDAVLFDLDGTLIDSTPAVLRSWVTWAHEHGIDPSRLDGNHGVPAAQIIAKVLSAERLPAALTRIVEIEVADVDGILVLPGAVEALQALGAGRSAIVTSWSSMVVLVRLSLRDWRTSKPALSVSGKCPSKSRRTLANAVRWTLREV